MKMTDSHPLDTSDLCLMPPQTCPRLPRVDPPDLPQAVPPRAGWRHVTSSAPSPKTKNPSIRRHLTTRRHLAPTAVRARRSRWRITAKPFQLTQNHELISTAGRYHMPLCQIYRAMCMRACPAAAPVTLQSRDHCQHRPSALDKRPSRPRYNIFVLLLRIIPKDSSLPGGTSSSGFL